jgi:nucleoid-associated protein YgaU
MDQRFRVTVAASVMLLGLALSLAFRRTGNLPAVGGQLASSQSAQLRSEPQVRQPDSKAALPTAFAPAPPLPPVAADANRLPPAGQAQSATVVTDVSGPPDLAPSYPGTFDTNAASQVGLANNYPFTRAGRSGRKITHRIVDGDSLAELAERYLGSASRAKELFEANRDLLTSPELLPIGAELKIPPVGHL